MKKENVNKLLDDIQKTFIDNKSTLQKAFEMDLKEWEYQTDFDKLLNCINNYKKKEYLPKFSKTEIVDGYGKIALVCTPNPYLIFNFILAAIVTNNQVDVVLENKLKATNLVMIETIRKALKDEKLDENMVNFLEVNHQEEIVNYQDKYDLLYYLGNKASYLNLSKRIHIDTKFEEFGEINVYMDSKEFKEQMLEIDKWAYQNEFKVNVYSNEAEAIRGNSDSKMLMIFSKDFEKIMRMMKKVKAKEIYINQNVCEKYSFDVCIEDLVYRKKIILNG